MNDVLIKNAHGAWEPPETRAYMDESHLQQVIGEQPSLVPGVGPGAHAALELSTSAGPIDVCIVDPNGDLTVVECKLASNSEKRRMVIGQVLDYASAIWTDRFDSFVSNWKSRTGIDLTDVLDGRALDDLRTNVARPRIHLCLAVDRIDDDLRRLIEYLNTLASQDISVAALQLSYARRGDIELVIPTTYGGEIAAAKARKSDHDTRSWTKEMYLDSIRDAADSAVVRDIFERCELLEAEGDHTAFWFGSFPRGGIFLHPHGLNYAPVQIWCNSAGEAQLFGNWKQYPTIESHPGFAELAELLGQDHTGTRQGVRIIDLDVDRMWEVTIRCARSINKVAELDQPIEALTGQIG